MNIEDKKARGYESAADTQLVRRRVLSRILFSSSVAVVLPAQWVKPVVETVLLPAHAQTSLAMCMADTTVGGPLLGNPSGATSCQAACEVEASSQNAQLCNVTESLDASGAVQCDCELDLPN